MLLSVQDYTDRTRKRTSPDYEQTSRGHKSCSRTSCLGVKVSAVEDDEKKFKSVLEFT